MSVRRPPQRYVGLTYTPAGLARREVEKAVQDAWAVVPEARTCRAPRLLMCRGGKAVVAVERASAPAARRAFEAAHGIGSGVGLAPVVTSGTVAGAKARLGERRARARGP